MSVAAAFIDADDPGATRGLTQAIADPLNVRGPFSDGDDGRLPFEVPGPAAGAFRTPTLRCVAQRPSFMHTAQLRSLAAVVAFFSKGGYPAGFVGQSEIHALDLTAEQQSDLVAFLRALDGPGADSSLGKAPP
jgi:cytochrome c peroxidase